MIRFFFQNTLYTNYTKKPLKYCYVLKKQQKFEIFISIRQI